MTTEYECPKCGFKATIHSVHQIKKCPACRSWVDWFTETTTVYSFKQTNEHADTTEEVEALANLNRARAERIRAEKGLPEPTRIMNVEYKDGRPKLIINKKKTEDDDEPTF